MNKKMHIHWDAQADYLELRFGAATESYYEEIKADVFERRDEKTNKVVGYAFFNVQKRKDCIPQDIVVDLPLKV